MNLDDYRILVALIEDILRGIKGKISMISNDEWTNMEMGAHAKPFTSKEEKIGWNRMLLRQQWLVNEKLEKVELLFETKTEMDIRINMVISEIVNAEVDFKTLENVLYAFLAMAYFSMRRLEPNEIVRIDIEPIVNTCTCDKEKKYIRIIGDVIFAEFVYAYNAMCYGQDEKTDYEQIINDLLVESLELCPQGEIANTLLEIKVIEEFFNNPTDGNLQKISEVCFNEKFTNIGHVMTCASSRMWDVDIPELHYIPHVVFNFGYEKQKSVAEEIKNSEPLSCWAGQEEELQERHEKWEENAIKRLLKIPYKIDIEQSQGEILYTLMSTLISNGKYAEQLKEASDSKSAMVSDFTHRYKNLAADSLYNIAQALLTNPGNDEGLKDKGRELLVEYDNKQMLAREVVMLNLEHTDKFDELADLIRRSVCSEKDGISIIQLVNEAAKRVLIRLLVSSDDDRVEFIRNKYEELGIDTWELLEKYEIDILREEKDCIKWINENMHGLCVEYESKWYEIYLRKNTEGSVFLSSLIMELLFNMFTYADIKCDKRIRFLTKKEDRKDYLMIETCNSVDHKAGSYTRKGIASRNRIISKLNYGSEYKWHNSIVTAYEEDKNEFCVQIKMNAELFSERSC